MTTAALTHDHSTAAARNPARFSLDYFEFVNHVELLLSFVAYIVTLGPIGIIPGGIVVATVKGTIELQKKQGAGDAATWSRFISIAFAGLNVLLHQTTFHYLLARPEAPTLPFGITPDTGAWGISLVMFAGAVFSLYVSRLRTAAAENAKAEAESIERGMQRERIHYDASAREAEARAEVARYEAEGRKAEAEARAREAEAIAKRETEASRAAAEAKRLETEAAANVQRVETQRIAQAEAAAVARKQAETQAEVARRKAEAEAEAAKIRAGAEAEARRIEAEAAAAIRRQQAEAELEEKRKAAAGAEAEARAQNRKGESNRPSLPPPAAPSASGSMAERIRAAAAQLETETGRKPTQKEIATRVGTTDRTVREYLNRK